MKIGSDLRPSSIQPDPMCPDVHHVMSISQETSDIYTLKLQPTERREAVRFAPGQFNMLYAFGVGECAISISGDPTVNNVTEHTIRRVGLVTGTLGSVRAGDSIGVRGPFGTPWPMDQARGRDVLLIAGGIGMAPLRPVIMDVLANRENYKELTILSGSRDPEGILFADELLTWKKQPGVDSKVTVDHADSRWNGNVGVVTTLVNRTVKDPKDTIAFVCGPEIMMRYAVTELQKNGLGKDQIYLSLERNMKCAIGLCGHCQFGSEFICRDGPVFRYDRIEFWLNQREL